MQAFKFICQLFNPWSFMDFFKWPIKKREKPLTMFASFWIKFTYLCLRQLQVYGRLFTSFIPGIWPFWGLVIVKINLTSVFYASVLLLMTNFVITLSKLTAAARGSTATLTMLWRNPSSISRQTHKKTDVNSLIGQSERNLPSGNFAYHLHRRLTVTGLSV